MRKNINSKKTKKLNLFNIFYLLSFILVLILIFRYFVQKQQIDKLKKEYSSLSLESIKLEEKLKTLSKELDKVNTLEYIEKKAREDLGMIKKDEKIYLPKEQLESIKEKISKETKEETKEETKSE